MDDLWHCYTHYLWEIIGILFGYYRIYCRYPHYHVIHRKNHGQKKSQSQALHHQPQAESCRTRQQQQHEADRHQIGLHHHPEAGDSGGTSVPGAVGIKEDVVPIQT